MENRFVKYLLWITDVNGKIIDSNDDCSNTLDECWDLFKSLYCEEYGSIDEDQNLISIHTGGWSDNEELISEFKDTYWWQRNFEIHATGGHYFFNTNTDLELEWKISKSVNS